MKNNLSANGISKSYNGQPALHDINLSVQPGEIFGFLGADGAGKSTLFKILTTLMKMDTGQAEVCGYDVDKDFRTIRRIIGYMPGTFSLYGDLSVEENLRFFARVFNSTLNENYDLIRDIYVLLEPFKKRRAADLSGGMKQKLALCCSLIHKPQILFLDEPTTGVDPVSRQEFWQNLKTVSSQGITTLVSTPYMDEAIQCDRVALIQSGDILQIDTPENIVTSFPKGLIVLKTDENKNILMNELKQIPGIESVFSFGESIHVTCEPESKQELMNMIKKSCNYTITFDTMAKPDIEDCFLYYMQRENG